MNKSDAVYHFHRQAEIWQYVGIICVVAMIGLMLYVLHLHTALSNCYAA